MINRMEETPLEEQNRLLYEKICAEHEQYKRDLLCLPAEEILHHAYAYTVREDIIFALEEHDLSLVQCKALLQSEHPLRDIFESWENTETHYMDVIRDTIDSTANEKVAEAKTKISPAKER